MARIADDFRLFGRILTFRATHEELQTMSWRLLAMGLVATWIVGIGRWWDDPRGEIPDYVRLGLGSVVYVFALSLLLWLASLPFTRRKTTYRTVLTFVACTSPPAILYAVPIEMIVSMDLAKTYNLIALGLVAAYRVGLLCWFLRKASRLNQGEVLLVGFTPIIVIIATLLQLGFAAKVFNIMGGIRTETANESAEQAIFLLGLFCFLAGPFFVLGYIFVAVFRMVERRAEKTPVRIEEERLKWRVRLRKVEVPFDQIKDIYASARERDFTLYLHLRNRGVEPLTSTTREFWSVIPELERRLDMPEGSVQRASEKDPLTHPVHLYSFTTSIHVNDDSEVIYKD